MKIEVSQERLLQAVELYREWNSKINVISRKDTDNILSHHIMHSLAVAEYLSRFVPGEFAPGQTVLDLGTGGGFPGIPLAMAFPDVHFVLCDSIGKKVRVASEVARELGLSNVECVNARAESLPGPFDWVVSRAVASLSDLYPWIRGRYRRGVLLLKGGAVGDEIAEFCRRFRFPEAGVRTWRISEWLDGEYFAEKFVIHI